MLAPQCRMVLWTGHAADQSGVARLADAAERDVYDGIAFVSEWQKAEFFRKFSLDPKRIVIMRNAIAPAFEGLFKQDESIVAAKAGRLRLAYTTTPFRGLDILLSVFPAIRKLLPETILRVYSGMKNYQIPPEKDQFTKLYDSCKATPGVEYIGPVLQTRLANGLRETAILAYPTTFAETSCIGVMEAMAAGCHVVTSEFGALPETVAGFGRLVPLGSDPEAYCLGFIKAVVESVNEPAMMEDALRRQVDFVNRSYVWRVRAGEWTAWLRGFGK
jgi:glycosyltransferase involved in cell wall biosynthesis